MAKKPTFDPIYFYLPPPWEITLIIIVPAIFFALLGRYMDEKFHSYPLFIIIFLVLAFIITAYALIRRTNSAYIDLVKSEPPKKKAKKTKKKSLSLKKKR